MRTPFPVPSPALLLLLLASACASVAPEQAGPRRDPPFRGRLTLAAGNYEHDIDGSLKDDTDATFAGLVLEGATRAGFGGGLSLELTQSDDDLFEGQTSSSVEMVSFELSPYFLYRLRAGERFRAPLRIGPWFHGLTLEDQAGSDDFEWTSFGLRLAAEPEVDLMRREDFAWTLFSELSLSGGATTIDIDTASGDEEFDSSAVAFGFEIGPRFSWSHVFVGLSYLHRSLNVDESDSEGGVVVREFDNSFDALAFSFGGVF